MAQHNITIVAHRGKGPTKSFTDPGHLWFKCQKENLLVDPFNHCSISNNTKPSIVPEKLMIKHNKLLISDVIPPENTIASFERAIFEGAEIIELDVFMSKDGIPVVTHDRELNRNVSGAKKDAQISELGYIGITKDYTAEELQLLNMGYGNKIPTLQEVVDFLYIQNTARDRENKPHLKLNIELKDRDSIEPVVNVIQSNIKSGKINNSDIIYCSFHHGRLEHIVTLDREANIALQLYTKLLYGQKNVNNEAGWTVDLDKQVTNHAICTIQNQINKIKSIVNHQNNSAVAIDTVLWDVDPKLIKFVKQEGLDLYVVGAFRDFSNIDFARHLLEMTKHVRVFFKTDEPGKIREILNQLSSNSSNLDSSSVMTDSIEKENFVSKDNYKDLQRLPKPSPNQKVLFIEKSSPNDPFRIIDQYLFTLYNDHRVKIAEINVKTLKVTIYDNKQFVTFLNKEGNNCQKFIDKLQNNFFEVIEKVNKKSYLQKSKILYKQLNSVDLESIMNKSVNSLIKQDIALWKKFTKDALKVTDKNINSITLLHKKELMNFIKKHILSTSDLQNESIDNNTLNWITKKICGMLYQSTESGVKVNCIYKKGLEQKFKGYISDKLKAQGLIVDKDINIKTTKEVFKLIIDNELNINIKSLIDPKKKHEINLYKKLLEAEINKLIDKNVVEEKAINKLHKIYDHNQTKTVLTGLEEQGNTKAIADLDVLKENIQSNQQLLDQQYNILKKLQKAQDYKQLSQKYENIKNIEELIKSSLEKLEKEVVTHYTNFLSTIDQDKNNQVNEGGNNYQYIENHDDGVLKHAECEFLGALPEEVVC